MSTNIRGQWHNLILTNDSNQQYTSGSNSPMENVVDTMKLGTNFGFEINWSDNGKGALSVKMESHQLCQYGKSVLIVHAKLPRFLYFDTRKIPLADYDYDYPKRKLDDMNQELKIGNVDYSSAIIDFNSSKNEKSKPETYSLISTFDQSFLPCKNLQPKHLPIKTNVSDDSSPQGKRTARPRATEICSVTETLIFTSCYFPTMVDVRDHDTFDMGRNGFRVLTIRIEEDNALTHFGKTTITPQVPRASHRRY
jgi:hypothetical protein